MRSRLYSITTVAHARQPTPDSPPSHSPPSHSLRRPTLDGDDGGDADEAQVDVPKSGVFARALPQPILTYRRPVAGQALLSSSAVTEHRTGPPAPTLDPKRALCHRRGLADLRLDGPDGQTGLTGCDGWAHPRDSQRLPGSPQGSCVHAKPNRDYDRPQSTQQAVRLPGSPGLSRWIVLPPPPDRMPAAGCFTMFWSTLPATCPCARARPPDRQASAAHPPAVRTQVRRAHIEEGCFGVTGPSSTSDGTNCSPEVNLDAKLLLPAHNRCPRGGPAAICRGALARSAVACAKHRTSLACSPAFF